MSVSPITNLEKQSLEAHVDLCAMRYGQLDSRLSILEVKVDKISEEILTSRKSLSTVLITTGGTITVSLISLIVTILMKF